MAEPTRIIQSAIVTEKANRLKESGQYTFVVLRTANKIEIKKAVEQLFNVKVRSVRVMNFLGKQRRMGIFTGHRPDWKKAVVQLKKGEKIASLEV